MFRKLDYFYASIKRDPAEGFRFLAQLATRNVDLFAVHAVPFGPDKAQLTLFPTNTAILLEAARSEGILLDGPHSAILVQGKDQIGAFAAVQSKLATANVDVFSVQGMTDGRGGFGYIMYVRPEDVARALRCLGGPLHAA